jgi:hypothetical protein
VRARRSVWPDAEVRRLLEAFIPAADEVWGLQHVKGPEGEFFRGFSEKGHYGGRTEPSDTRQGLYAVAPSGEFLASINSNDAKAVAGMLRRALDAWKALPAEKRLGPEREASPKDRPRMEARFPEGGAILFVHTRDLPRGDGVGDGPWANAWNRDQAWLRPEDVAAFLPGMREVGATSELPPAMVRRLARCHLVDTVRGQTFPYPDRDVVEAKLKATVISVEGAQVTLRLEGSVTLLQKGRWPINGFRDADSPTEQERRFTGTWRGEARFETKETKLLSFTLVTAGLRHGATQYNGRADDLGPAPLGVVFTLAEEGTAPVAPAALWEYRW